MCRAFWTDTKPDTGSYALELQLANRQQVAFLEFRAELPELRRNVTFASQLVRIFVVYRAFHSVRSEYLAIFKKTVAMHEIFLCRLAQHPQLRNNHNFRVFLEYDSEVQGLFGEVRRSLPYLILCLPGPVKDMR